LRPLLRTSDDDLFATVGLDALAFLRFMRMLAYMFTVISILACCALIPIVSCLYPSVQPGSSRSWTQNVVYNRQKVALTDRNAMSMLTISNVGGNILFVHIGVNYLMSTPFLLPHQNAH
jgi:hypothetical protein